MKKKIVWRWMIIRGLLFIPVAPFLSIVGVIAFFTDPYLRLIDRLPRAKIREQNL